MVSIKDTKKYASPVILNNRYSSLTYYPLQNIWIDGEPIRNYVKMTFRDKERFLDIERGLWCDCDFVILPSNEQQSIRNILRKMIEDSNPDIRRLKEHKRKDIISMIIKDMHRLK